MAGRRGTTDPQLTQEELNALRAQTQLTNAQIQALFAKTQIEREQLGVEKGKLELGGKQLTSEEKRSQLNAALDALKIGGTERIESGKEKGNVLSDLMHRADVPPATLAATLAAAGRPELYNALATEKAVQREKAVRSIATNPEFTSAKSDAEREKKFKAALEATYPGGFEQARALAFPKPGYTPTFEPELYKAPGGAAAATSTPAIEGDRYANLTNKLLEAAGFGGAGGPIDNRPVDQSKIPLGNFAYNDPNTKANYFYDPSGVPRVGGAGDPSVGALAGSMVVDEGNGRYGIYTPSGGYIGGKGDVNRYRAKIDRETMIENRLAAVRAGGAGALAAIPLSENTGTPRMDIPLVPPPELPTITEGTPTLGKTLAALTAPTPIPTPTPVVTPTPTATPRPEVTPNAEMLAELARRAEEERRRREAMAQNQQ